MSPSSGSRSVNVAGEVVGGVSCGAPGDADVVPIALSVSMSPICASGSFRQSGVFENLASTGGAARTLLRCRNAVATGIVGTPIPAFMRVSGSKPVPS